MASACHGQFLVLPAGVTSFGISMHVWLPFTDAGGPLEAIYLKQATGSTHSFKLCMGATSCRTAEQVTLIDQFCLFSFAPRPCSRGRLLRAL